MGSAGFSDVPKPWTETPLIESQSLTKAAGCRIFLKLEFLQPSGSFKSRGIGNLVLHHALAHASDPIISSKPLHFFSSSGGNAGLACVTAARALGFPASVVVPLSTKPVMVAKLKAAGASEVIQAGASWQFADNHLREVVLKNLEADGQVKGVYVPPFDDPLIWDGNSTIIEEIRDQLPHAGLSAIAEESAKPDAIVCSVGGGGLFAGICQGLDRMGWADVPVLAMETKGADSLAHALQARQHVALDGITSLASSLGAVRVAYRAFQDGQRANVKSVVLSDAQACMGAWRLADDERILVEPACGVNVAPCYTGDLKKALPGLDEKGRVVVVLCGGNGVSLDLLKEWRDKFGPEVEGIKEV